MARPRNKHGISLAEYRNTAALYVVRGEDAPNVKLNDDIVRKIRASPARHTAWAQKLGCSEANIRAIREYRSWKHVR